MVDEFQDVNPLQSELLELMARDNLFRVGRREPVDLRLPPRRRGRVPRPPRRGGRARARAREHHRELPHRAARCSTRSTLAFERALGRRFEPLREAPGAREPAPREPCVELLVVDLDKGRWDEALPPERGRRSARAMARRRRPGGRSRRGCWPSAIDELTRDGPLRVPRRGGAAARHHAAWPSTSGRSRSAASPPTWSAAAATGASSRWPTCATGWRRWPTRSTSWRSTRVLASPLGGLSLDAVALIGLHAPRGPSATPVGAARGRRGRPRASCCRPRDRPRGAPFVERFDAERARGAAAWRSRR